MDIEAPKNGETAAPDDNSRPSTLGTLIEPGVAFMFGDMLLFMSGGGIPFGVCLGATILIASLNGAKAAAPETFNPENPKKDDKNPDIAERARRLMSDIRTPLRLAGGAMVLVAVNAASAGLVIPALTSAAFAVGNVLLGESLHKAIQSKFNKVAAKPRTRTTFKSGLKTLFTGPDLYVALGLAGAAAMASPIAAIAMIPFIATGFGTSLYNALNGKHESNGHPKAVYGIACLGAGIAGLMVGTGPALLAGAANLLFAAVNVYIEGQVTDGGLKKVASNFMSAPAKAAGFIGKKLGLTRTPKPKTVPEPTVIKPLQPVTGNIPAPLSPQFKSPEKTATPEASADTKPKSGPKAV